MGELKGAILQPTYLPWIGYFEIIGSVDLYVVFDHVQFVKKSWQQRNKIKGPNGIVTLTVPIQRVARDTKICDIKVSYDQGNALEKHWKTISLAYSKSPYFTSYESIFREIFSRNHIYLRDLNVELIKRIMDILDIRTKIVISSELGLSDQNMGKTERIVSLCKNVGITYLYDGKGAQQFIDTPLFHRENIAIEFQNFVHPGYTQMWGKFVPYLSAIDLLFNEGEKSMEVIRSGKSQAPEKG